MTFISKFNLFFFLANILQLYHITLLLFLERDEIIKERVVGFVFFNDFIMIPKDPYGKNGRTLQLILHKLKPEAKIDEKYLEK